MVFSAFWQYCYVFYVLLCVVGGGGARARRAHAVFNDRPLRPNMTYQNARSNLIGMKIDTQGFLRYRREVSAGKISLVQF